MMRGASRAFRSARLTWQRLLKDERGSVLAFFVAIPVVAGTVAVGVETGQLYRTKRQMQGAADAAALAGAIDKVNGGTNTSATAAALYEAQRNGFQNGVGGVTVTVNSPPTSGSNVSTANAVEVIVAKPSSFALANVLSSALGNTFSMTSRSVAAQSSVTSTSTHDHERFERRRLSRGAHPAAEQGVSFTSLQQLHVRLRDLLERHVDRHDLVDGVGLHGELQPRDDEVGLYARQLHRPTGYNPVNLTTPPSRTSRPRSSTPMPACRRRRRGPAATPTSTSRA